MASSVLRTIDSALYRNECEQEVLNVNQRSMQSSKPKLSVCMVYPNPANTELKIDFKDAAIRTIDMYNYLGEKVYSIKSDDTENTIILDNFASGVYTLKISVEGLQVYIEKISIIK